MVALTAAPAVFMDWPIVTHAAARVHWSRPAFNFAVLVAPAIITSVICALSHSGAEVERRGIGWSAAIGGAAGISLQCLSAFLYTMLSGTAIGTPIVPDIPMTAFVVSWAIVEEQFVRGVVLGQLLSRPQGIASKVAVIVTVNLLWSLAHTQGVWNRSGLFVVGVVLSYLRLRRGLGTAIAAHASFNLTAMILGARIF